MIVIILSILILAIYIVLNQNRFLFPASTWESGGSVPADVKESFISTSDGEKIQVWERTIEGQHDVVAIILTGNGDTIDAGGYGNQKWLADLKIPSLAFSYRGYGQSTGSPSEAGLKKDIEAVYKFGTETLNYKKILIIAISVGTGPGTYIAFKEDVEAMVLFSPYTSLKDVVKTKPVFKYLSPLLLTNFSNYNEFSKAEKFPCTLILHGAKDIIIPSEQSKILFDLAKGNPNVERQVFAEAGHNDLSYYARESVEQTIAKCLQN